MSSDTQRVIADNEAKRQAAIAKAKAAAVGKEPLDVAFVKKHARTSALGIMSDAELVTKLEDMYYVDHPQYKTNQELVDLIQQLADYQ